MLKRQYRRKNNRCVPKHNNRSKVETYLTHYNILENTESRQIGVLTLEKIFRLAKTKGLKLKINRVGFLNLKLDILNGKSLKEKIKDELRKPEDERNFDEILKLVKVI